MKVGFLTIGEGGSNIGEYAVQKGFPVVAVNTAKVDLDKLKMIPKDSRIYLQGSEGAGRNRDIGKNIMLTNAEEILLMAKDKFEDCDMIFAVGSSAGGTGSGGLPIGIEILLELDCQVGVITILPELNESPKALMNSLECFSELSQFDRLSSIVIIDNEKAKELFDSKDKSRIYQLSNEQFINNLQEVISFTRKSSYTSNFDKNDLLEIIGERGCTIISKVQVPLEELSDPHSISKVIRESWQQVCSPELWEGQIVKASILGKIPKEMTTEIDINMIFNDVGLPYEIFESYYPNNDHTNHCIFYTILSGMVFPSDRLNQMEESVKKIEQVLLEKVEVARSQTFETTSRVSKFSKQNKKTENKQSLTERLSKFK